MKFWLYCSAFAGCCLSITVLLTNINSMDMLKYIFTSFTDSKVGGLSILTHQRLGTSNLASSVWCVNRLDGSKLCHFENLYHLPQYKEYFFFLLNEHSVISGVKSFEVLKKLEISTVQNHPSFYLKLVVIKSSDYLLQQHFIFINDHIFLMKRFKPDNIMHIIHDDLLPLFFTFHELCKGKVDICLSKYKLLFIDGYGKGPYHEWYQSFSQYESMFLDTQKTAVCFQNIVLGLNHKTTWFQYGFKKVQGPLLKTDLNTIELEQFTHFIKHQFGVVHSNLPSDPSDTKQVIFLSRRINRKILHDTVVVERIKHMYKKPIRILNMDLSVNSSKEIISALQKTNTLIGMHGSSMILSIFLPQGSNIIELFPFGIQPKYVSALKTLCSFPNIFYNYHSWVNENENNTIIHPEYPPLLGGILHLSSIEQEYIIKTKLVPPVECCHNPLYLFRMFQDTIVDNNFLNLVLSVLNNVPEISLTEEEIYKIKLKNVLNLWYFPPPVFNLVCNCKEINVFVHWSYPMMTTTNVTFSIATSTGIIDSSKDTYYHFESEMCRDKTQISIVKPLMSVWVKAMEGDQESIDSYTKCN